MASKDSRPHKKKKETRTISDVKRLGHELLSSRSHINNLPLLLAYVSPSSPPQYALESLLSLQSFFATVLPDLPPSSSKAAGDASAHPDLIYRTWLRSKFDEFVNSLVEVAIRSDCDEMLREVMLDSIMELVKLGNKGKFYSALYHKLLQNIVYSPLPIEFLMELLASKYFKYVDIRYFTYISIAKLVKTLEAGKSSGGKYITANGDDENRSESSPELSVNKMHFLLSHIPPLGVSTEEMEHEIWSGPEFLLKEGDIKKNHKVAKGKDEELKVEKSNQKLQNISKRMRLKLTKAWMSFLRLPLPLDVYKEVLVILHQAVIPYMSNPAMLCDFLTRSYDIGGVVSVMALSGLFILMTQYGLEYPNFYEKLYALLGPSIFMAKHRAKFFELLDSCLKSPLLPAYLAAAFTKKLSRLSLVVPPSGSMVIIALVHNLLRRHPSINFLVQDKHIKTESDVNQNKRGVDHFNDEESDPRKTHALKSSLWEIDSLRHHYCPHVSRFVLSLENDMTVRAKTSEITIKDFSSGSYSTIFREEMRRRVKHVPLAFYKATPTSLFSENDFPGWTFKYEESQEEEAHA